MADKKISQLPAATLPLAGTELLPIVQSGTTDNITVNNLAVGNIKSNATTGVLQVSGPAAGTTRVMTTPDANFTAARTDAAQTFTGNQSITTEIALNTAGSATTQLTATVDQGSGTGAIFKIRRGRDIGAGSIDAVGLDCLANSGLSVAYVRGYDLRLGVNAGEALRLTDTGDANVKIGNLVIGTSGKGIDFSATASGSGTMTSELLADYEEGTWTPTAYGATTAGDTTYLSASGAYVKVGKQVTITGVLDISGMTGTGNLIIGGLPYALANTTSGSLGNFLAKNLTIPTVSDLILFGNGGTAVSVGGTGNGVTYQWVQVDNTFSMYFSMTYISLI